MTTKELIQLSLHRCQQLRTRYPDVLPIKSLLAQLEYLLALEEGRSDDLSKLQKLTIGVIAAREIEERDAGLAILLYRVLDDLGL